MAEKKFRHCRNGIKKMGRRSASDQGISASQLRREKQLRRVLTLYQCGGAADATMIRQGSSRRSIWCNPAMGWYEIRGVADSVVGR